MSDYSGDLGEQEAVALARIEEEFRGEPTVAALAIPERRGSALVRLAAPIETIEAAFHDYQTLITKILDDSDYQRIGDRRFPKKSAWRKLAVAFGVSFQRVYRIVERDPDGRSVVYAEFVYRAVAPNGRYAEAMGSCDLFERCCLPGCSRRHQHCPAKDSGTCPGFTHFSHANHDVPATAETRAKNRAASDLFGMGEVSAEEVLDTATDEAPGRAPARRAGSGEPITNDQMNELMKLRKEAGEKPDVRGLKKLTKADAQAEINARKGLADVAGDSAQAAPGPSQEAPGQEEATEDPSAPQEPALGSPGDLPEALGDLPSPDPEDPDPAGSPEVIENPGGPITESQVDRLMELYDDESFRKTVDFFYRGTDPAEITSDQATHLIRVAEAKQ